MNSRENFFRTKRNFEIAKSKRMKGILGKYDPERRFPMRFNEPQVSSLVVQKCAFKTQSPAKLHCVFAKCKHQSRPSITTNWDSNKLISFIKKSNPRMLKRWKPYFLFWYLSRSPFTMPCKKPIVLERKTEPYLTHTNRKNLVISKIKSHKSLDWRELVKHPDIRFEDILDVGKYC
jgi:hypothetical protein